MVVAVPMEEGRVFVLGAGFSAGAKIPLTNVLLPAAVSLFREEAAGLFQRISNYAQDVDVDLAGSPDAKDFARFCTYLDFVELREHGGGERWSREGSRERVALKFFLAKAIAAATPTEADIPAHYLEFAKHLNTSDVIVTFNWDLLLEKALRRIGLPYGYAGQPDRLLILKLHGSINWIDGVPRAMARDSQDFSYVEIGFCDDVAEDVHSSDLLFSADEWRNARCLVDQVKPLLVLPGYGKAVDLRLLAPIWYRPEALSLRQGGVSIIGLSVADDDYIMDGLFRYLLRATLSDGTKVRLINPDENVAEKFAALSGKARKVDFHKGRFEADAIPFAMFRD